MPTTTAAPTAGPTLLERAEALYASAVAGHERAAKAHAASVEAMAAARDRRAATCAAADQAAHLLRNATDDLALARLLDATPPETLALLDRARYVLRILEAKGCVRARAAVEEARPWYRRRRLAGQMLITAQGTYEPAADEMTEGGKRAIEVVEDLSQAWTNDAIHAMRAEVRRIEAHLGTTRPAASPDHATQELIDETLAAEAAQPPKAGLMDRLLGR